MVRGELRRCAQIAFSACLHGGDFAILFAMDALIVLLQLCGLSQVGWLEPQLPRRRFYELPR